MRGKLLVTAGVLALLGFARPAAAQTTNTDDDACPPGMMRNPTTGQLQALPPAGQSMGQPNPYGQPSQYSQPMQPGQPSQYGQPNQYGQPSQYGQYPNQPPAQYGAAAQPQMAPQQNVNVNVQPYQTEERRRKSRFAPYQASLSVGGGVANFVRDRISDNTGTAGAWDVRLGIGTRFPLGFEAGYLGTVQHADDPFATRTIGSTQVFGLARLNLTTWRVQPFVGGGVGWANLHRYGNAADSPVAAANFNRNANDVVVPFTGGLAAYLGTHGLLDARFNYHLIPEKNFANTTVRPDMWIAELRAGYAF